jgi:peptide-methionine (S)-S-oxide reductase
MPNELATFGAGCFWGVEAAFRKTNGVLSTQVGYCGGTTTNPAYKEVCTGKTGHAECVQIEFNPSIISYDKLLEIFWNIHDPTTLNRQGPDIGTQYRSVIFYHDDEQKKLADSLKIKLDTSGKLKNKIVTEVVPYKEFFKAEEYHQNYFEKMGIAPTCHQ